MKKLFLFVALFTTATAYSQMYVQGLQKCGIYLTVDDYLNGKLTDEGNKITEPAGRGNPDYILIHTKDGKKEHKKNKIWGYKIGLGDYKMIDGKPRLVICRGAIYAFIGRGAFVQNGKKIIFSRRSAIDFGTFYLTKDLRTIEPTEFVNYYQIWRFMDTQLVKQVKKYGQSLVDGGQHVVFPEQIINYYNSLLPGYIAPIYSETQYENVMNVLIIHDEFKD